MSAVDSGKLATGLFFAGCLLIAISIGVAAAAGKGRRLPPASGGAPAVSDEPLAPTPLVPGEVLG